jgi:hypothetical protein
MMVKLLGRALLVGCLVVVSAPAAAQHKSAGHSAATPRHEIGVDFSAFYDKPSGGSGGVVMGLPVDLRIGLLTHKRLMWEPRLSFAFSSIGATSYTVVPALNALYQLRRGTGPYNLVGSTYATGGVALNFYDLGSSWMQVSVGGGVGKRVPFEGSAARLEAFAGYTFKGGGFPSDFAIGTRIGLSFWH